MRVAIAGGTGTLGAAVARALSDRGHEVRALSRSAPEHRVDLTTGEGLDAALDGCDVVVNAANQPPSGKGPSVLVEGTRRLLVAGARHGVAHHVDVSIVGCDRVPLGYYRVKTRQEQVVEDGPVRFTIVRATQFHELLDQALGAVARARLLPVPRGARLQTIAVVDAASAIADVAEAAPRQGRLDVAGPEVRDVADLARAWRAVRGRRAPVLAFPLPGGLGRALRDGALTSERPDVRATTTFEAWLPTPAT